MDRAGCSKLSIVASVAFFFRKINLKKIIKASVINLIQQLWGCPTSMCKMWSSGLETLKLAAQEGTFSLTMLILQLVPPGSAAEAAVCHPMAATALTKTALVHCLENGDGNLSKKSPIAIAKKSGKGRNTFEEEILQARDARDFLHNCRDWFIIYI